MRRFLAALLGVPIGYLVFAFAGSRCDRIVHAVLTRIADHPASRLHELLPWHWKATQEQPAAA